MKSFTENMLQLGYEPSSVQWIDRLKGWNPLLFLGVLTVSFSEDRKSVDEERLYGKFLHDLPREYNGKISFKIYHPL